MIPDLWTTLLLTALPMYIANSTAVIFGGKTPIDFNRMWLDGKPIFGKGKTWNGLGMGVRIGTFSGGMIHYFFPEFVAFIAPNYTFFAGTLALGALLGDAIGSFLKRRQGMISGQPAHLLDQLDFVFGALALSLLAAPANVTVFLLLIMITPFMH
ncbi:MAG: CDP-2,3-bis-(O-geranylgeranyl)-sn-glycerol synthase, partial [archaeon]